MFINVNTMTQSLIHMLSLAFQQLKTIGWDILSTGKFLKIIYVIYNTMFSIFKMIFICIYKDIQDIHSFGRKNG